MILASESDAQKWLQTTFPSVPRETWDRLGAFEALLRAESERQNLIARGTFANFQLRHVIDSAQLLRLATNKPQRWLDIGSGAGFPGLIAALLSDHLVTLVESRRLRIEFLNRAAEVLSVTDRVTILGSPLERIPPAKYDIISARAFAPLPRLLQLAHPFSTEKTRWILPKGRSADQELEAARFTWQGEFRLEPSLTDPDARIIVAEGVRPKRKNS